MPSSAWVVGRALFCHFACGLMLAATATGLVAQATSDLEAEFKSAVPASPAFLFLGATPTKISRPATTRDLGLALLNGVGPDGDLTQGFALEASPWVYLDGLTIPLEEYQASWTKRALANLQLSIGAARVAGDSPKTDMAFGFRIPIYDSGDPMADPDLVRELGEALLQCLPEDDPDIEEVEVQLCTDDATTNVFEAYTKEHWNSPRLSLAFAVGARIDRTSTAGTGQPEPETLSNYRGFQAWLAGAFPVLTSGGLFIGQVTFIDQPEFVTGSEMRGMSVGGRLVLGSPTANLFAEGVAQVEWPRTSRRDSSGSWSAGVEFRLAKDLWVSTGLGREFDRLGQPDRTLVLANVRWGVTSAVRLGELQRGAQANASGGG